MNTPTPKPCLILLVSLLCGLLPAQAQVPAVTPRTADPVRDAAVQLPQFTVSSEKGDPYRPADTMSLARIRGLLIDTPVTVNVLSRELLNDLGANSTFEAARYFPGIGNGRGAGTNGGINDRMNFRGFESQTRTLDNFSQTFIPGTSTSIDTVEPEFMERVEIVMGPNAILNPTGTPGGSMNVVTKSPLFTQQGMVRLILGNYSAQKFAFDVTGPVPVLGNRKLAYRLIGTAQDTETYIPGGFEKWTVGAMLLYQLTPTSQITLKYFGVDFKAFENASAPNDNGWLIYEPTSIGGRVLDDEPRTPGVTYNGRNGVNANSITTERTNNVQLVYTGSLLNFISVRLGGQLLTHNNVGDSAFPSSTTNSNTFDPVTGQVTAAPAFNPAAVPVVWRYNKGVSMMHSFQNDFAANFTPTETTTLQAVTGWAYNHNHNFPSRTGTAPMPAVNLFTGEGHFAPRPDIHSFSFTNRNESQATQKQAYALLKAGFLSERAFVTGGATRTWVKSEQYSRHPFTGALAANSPARLKGHRDSYIGSLLVKPVRHVSVYYTYSTNANLVTFNSGNGVVQPLWSQGKQHEYGVKSEFLNQRLSFTATHFDMEQTNVTSPNPLANINPGSAGNILTNNTSKGYEFSLVGGLTKQLSVIASYTTMKYRDAFDRRVRNVPDEMANGLLRYGFTEGRLKNLSVFGGVSYFGEAPGETITALAPAVPGQARVPGQPGFYTAAWHVINAGASYTHGRWDFNLNVDNLTNRKFGWQPASRLTVSPYPEITYRLTTSLRF